MTAIRLTFPPVTEEEALTALTAAGCIMSATEVTWAVATARGVNDLDHHSVLDGSKANRALGKLADAGKIIKIDRKNGDDTRYMQPGWWQDGRYGWATAEAADKARQRREKFDAARATDAGNTERIAAAIPAATQVQVRSTFTSDPGHGSHDVIKIEMLIPVADFEAFASALEAAR